MHGDKRYLDQRLKQFLEQVKTLIPRLNESTLAQLKDVWRDEITANFSIGGIRQVMREAPEPVRVIVSEILAESANTADTAMQALLVWPYYVVSVRHKLVEIVCTDKDPSAGNHAAYILARLPGLPLGTKERAMLLSFLVDRDDGENAENALRWAMQNYPVLSIHEVESLTELTSRVSR